MKKVEPWPKYPMIVTVHNILQIFKAVEEPRNEKAPSIAGGALVKIVVS